MRRPLTASLFAIAFVFAGCADPPPPPPVTPPPPPPPVVTAEPTATAAPEPPPGDGTEASPYHLQAGRIRPIRLEVPQKREAGYRLDDRTDVVLAWAGDGPVEVRPGIGPRCKASPCLKSLVPKGAYEVLFSGDMAASKQTVSVTALAPPPAVVAKPGKAVTLKPKALSEGDPRGRIADATLHFDKPGPAVVDLRPLGKRRILDIGEMLEKVHVSVHGGPAGVNPQAAMSPDVGGALQITFAANAGDYTLRLRRETDDMPDAVEVTLHRPPKELGQEWGELILPPRRNDAYTLLTPGNKVDIEVPPQAVSPRTWVDLPAGFDLAVTWKQPEGRAVPVTIQRPDYIKSCLSSPCLLDHPKAVAYAIFGPPQMQPATLDVDVRILPFPSEVPTLALGAPTEVSTALLAPDDLRGALAEVSIDLPSTGIHELTVKILDFKPPSDPNEAARAMPKMAVFAPDGHIALASFGLDAVSDRQAGLSRATFVANSAGKYTLRLDGDGDSKPRKLQVTVEKATR